eukprot:NODE_67_length_25542_cov_1.476831.p4 type:complete len:564 gc:universal NODE_67_length_25542_cov_1.476831:8867-7176(-)
MATLAKLDTAATRDPKKIMREINFAKESKDYKKLSGLYNLLAQASGDISYLEKAEKYHGHANSLDKMTTYLSYSEMVEDPLQIKHYLDKARDFLESVDKHDRIYQILDLCDCYSRIESPLDVLDLVRSVKRADDKHLFKLLILKAKSQRQLLRMEEALSTINEAMNISNISHFPKYRVKILSEMAKIYGEKGDYESEARLKSEYFGLVNKEELQVSDESLSEPNENYDVEPIIAHFKVKVEIIHRSEFLEFPNFELDIDNTLSRSEIQNLILAHIRKNSKLPRLLLKKVEIPKKPSFNSKLVAWISNSTLPSISKLYTDQFKQDLNELLLALLENNLVSRNEINLQFTQLTDPQFNFTCRFLKSNIQILNINDNFLEDISIGISKFKHLRQLNARNNCLRGSLSLCADFVNISCWKDVSIENIADNVSHLILEICEFNLPTCFDAILKSRIVKLSVRESTFSKQAYFNFNHCLKSLIFLKELDISAIQTDDLINLESVPVHVSQLYIDFLEFNNDTNFNLNTKSLDKISIKSSIFSMKSYANFNLFVERQQIRQIVNDNILIR